MSDQNLATVAEPAPPGEVFTEPMDDMTSLASSSMPSRRTVRLAALFPSPVTRFGNFESDSHTIKLLRERLQLDASFITRMEQCGYIKMSIIINRFGLDTKDTNSYFRHPDA